MLESLREISGETCSQVKGDRSQSLRSTAGLKSEARPIKLGNWRPKCRKTFEPNPMQRRSEKRGIGKPRRGKGGRKVEAGKTERARA